MHLLPRSCVSSLLISLAYGQRFSEGISYDFAGIETLNDGCKASLNLTVGCHWLLPTFGLEPIDLTSENLTAICTKECSESLASIRSSIESACSTESDVVVVDNIAYPATTTIDSLISTNDQLCLKDTQTQEFCYDIMRDWQDEEGLSDEQACSDCLLQTLQHDQASSFSYSGEFASDFSSLTSSCGKTGYEPTAPTSIALNTTKPTASVPTQVCPPSATYTLRADDTCNGLCVAYNVSTYSLLSHNGLNAYCRDFPKVGTGICLPPSCNIYTVQQGDTCRSVAVQQLGISITQLQAWNPNLNLLCTNMEQQRGMQICVSPPNSTLHTHENSQAAASSPTSPIGEPTNVANATNTQCGKYYLVQAGDTCADISVREGISLPDFYFLNKGINSDCTNLFAEESYCVLPVGDIKEYPGYEGGATSQGCAGPGSPSTCYGDWSTLSPTPFSDTMRSLRWRTPYNGETTSSSHPQHTTASATVTSPKSTSAGSDSGIATPSPVQDGMVDRCTAFYKVQSGDGCWAIANDHDISLEDFYSWNPAIGDDCSKLYPDMYVCISQSCDIEVTFKTTYATEWGESIWVVGSLPELGEWNVSNAFMLGGSAADSSTAWSGTISLPAGVGVGYKFVKLQTDGTPVWEEAPNRGFDTPECGGSSLTVGGDWHSTADSENQSSCTVGVTFKTTYTTEWGESIWVVGSLPELGEWNVSNAFMLGGSAAGSSTAWSGTISLPAGVGVGYKFVKLQTDGTPVWEEAPNRGFDTPGCGGSSPTIGGDWHSTADSDDQSSCTIDVTFKTTYATEWGESIWVVGSLPELGEWNVSNAFMLGGSAAGSSTAWSGTISLPAGVGVGYKFVKLQTDGTPVWEEAPNRGFDTSGCSGPGMVVGGNWQDGSSPARL